MKPGDRSKKNFLLLFDICYFVSGLVMVLDLLIYAIHPNGWSLGSFILCSIGFIISWGQIYRLESGYYDDYFESLNH